MSTYSVIYNTNPYQKAQARTQNQKKARIRAAKKKQADITDVVNRINRIRGTK